MDDTILIFALVLTVGLAFYSLESTRDCRMEAASKGYNVKEICE